MKLDSVLALKHQLLASDDPTDLVLAAMVVATRSEQRSRVVASRVGGFASAREHLDVGLGVAVGSGRNDYRLAATIRAPRELGDAVAASLRRQAGGELLVRIVPDLRAFRPRSGSWFQRRRRPLEAGLSIGNVARTAGTLGCFVEDTEAYFILSNNHVLAHTNRADVGSAVVQPGPLDEPANARNLVGFLDKYVPISFLRRNLVDAAIARLDPDIWMYSTWTEAIRDRIRVPKPLSVDDLAMPVFKAGRTTGVTEGIVTQVNVDRLGVDFSDPGGPKSVAHFDDQIECVGVDDTVPFSQPGDSGSLIVDGRGHARALLFAGGRDHTTGVDVTFANRIESVLDALRVRLVHA